MNLRLLAGSAVFCGALASLMAAESPAKTYDFPIYKNSPPGRQVSGQHAPAATPPLPAAEAQKKFTVPEGFEVRLFATEPEVVNPVAMTWDDRGRLWVVELYEYPLGAKPGEKPRDRIKILEDVDADGRADKITVFADGLNLATGILLGDGGAYVGQAPYLLFMKDTNGDDKVDETTQVLTGFGLEDRHELLNGFTWGPDGQLYMTHGVFTHSKVKNPDDPNDDGVVMNAAVARFDTRGKKFEIVSDGTSNPWGVDFDRYGNAFVSACVIDHLFHLSPGGMYVRQAGQPAYPYAYQLLPSIVDHRHHMAAYAGVQVYQGDQFPEEYRGTILMGNIHDNSIHQDKLTPNGSSFKASFMGDFVRANDPWFRPVSTQIGPDGAVWLMDWYDKYPCYQNANADPEGVDREYGRIWRVVYTGKEKGKAVPSRPTQHMDLAKWKTDELVMALAHPNIWQRRTAQRLLNERRDATAKPLLEKLLAEGRTLEARLFALWTLHSSGQLTETTLDRYVEDTEAGIRQWVARLTGERRIASEMVEQRLIALASDRDPSVRLGVATAVRQFVSSSLTINTPVPAELAHANPGVVLGELIRTSADAKDPLIPFMIWLAAEPSFARNPEPGLSWLAGDGAQYFPLSGILARKAMRRLCDMNKPEMMDLAVQFIDATLDSAPAVAVSAIEDLMEGQRGKAQLPKTNPADFLTKLRNSSNPEIKQRGTQLGTLWGDAASIAATLKVINDPSAKMDDRLRAIQSARHLKNDAMRDALLTLLNQPNPEQLLSAGVGAFSEMTGDAGVGTLLEKWKSFSITTRRAVADALASRRAGRVALVKAINDRAISPSDLSVTVIRTLTSSGDEQTRAAAKAAIGKFREISADKAELILAKRKAVLSGTPNLQNGREVTRKTCLVCHKLHGEGAEVGPDLTGVGRSTLDALLANVIDPNQVIGKGYENVEVETKDGRSVSGRLVEDTDSRMRLLAAGPREEVVAKSDVAGVRVSELSVMPEGLEQMSDEDFRDMMWYILNPPQDNRPLTPELRKELVGDEKTGASLTPKTDGESVALWNPEWRVLAPETEGTPRKLPDHAGNKNVLMTHPVDREQGAALERKVKVLPNRQTRLVFFVAAHEQGDWELRVLVDDKRVHQEIVTQPTWRKVSLDLSPYAGREITLRLENCANDWNFEFGFWSDIEVTSANLTAQTGKRTSD